MNGNDASHDAAHVWRVRDLALSLAQDEGLSLKSSLPANLAALLHDIGDYKYVRDPSEEKMLRNFWSRRNGGGEENKILGIIKGMDSSSVNSIAELKEEVAWDGVGELSIEFGVVQDADRLDAMVLLEFARCFTFGGSRNRVLHDPNIKPRSDLSKEQYMKKDEQTTINHFHEKLLKLKDMMKTKAGRSRAEKRHKFMEEYLKEFYEEWDGKLEGRRDCV
ncbi:hypothetical protein F8388_025980 [Cannabis sativa]|uniref:HD/PDEase domain-containing protein n=1 Tax=Cannabis sativa TaxID=3483 RepID=A0A7J6EC16_CANSA|nr:hypothetical protein F8388_025980 [Cannabis sativa]